MSNEQALFNCTFGWGKTCRLYYDSMEIAGKSYNLKDLTSIHPSYRVVLGVPSARLELSFGLDHLILRGIADLHVARLMVSHLQPYCSTTPHVAHARTRSSRSRNLARAQARAWERTNKLPIIPLSHEEIPLSACLPDAPTPDKAAPELSGFDEEPPTDQALTLDAVPKAPIENTTLTAGETLEAFAQLSSNLSTYAGPLPSEFWQPPHTPRYQPPLHSIHLIHPNHKFDSGSMPVPAVKSSVLPIIHVPMRLQHGECAHYSIGAILCSDRISSATRATYPLLDNGLMILTNRRVLYVGKRCQFTLAYTHLWYVSLLHSAIALHIEGQFRRIIIELEHPQEWASRVELLSFIARRERTEPPTVSVAAVPGLNMTVKRQAVKPPSAKNRAATDKPTIPLLTERVESKVVEAETIELTRENSQACADHQTLDYPEPAPLELVRSNTPRIAHQPDVAQKPTQEFSLPTQQPDIAQKPTQEFSLAAQPSDIAQSPTQEFSLPAQPDITQSPTQEFSLPAQPDITQSPTQEFSLPAQPDITQSPTQEFSLAAQPPSDITQSPTQEFSLSSQPLSLEETPTQAILCKSEITKITTREFSPPSQPGGHNAPERAPEKSTQGLQLDLAEVVRLREAQPPEQRQELTTSALPNPDLPLAKLARAGEPSAEVRTQELDDDDERTIHLYDRKLSQLRTVSLATPTTDNLPDSEKIEQRRPRTRVPQRPS